MLVDSSGPELVCAVASGVGVIRERRVGARQPGVDIAVVCADLLSEVGADSADSIVVGTGPGSFIGTRTAISFANGYAAAREITLSGVGSLVAMSAANPDCGAVLRDARRGQFYCLLPGSVEPVVVDPAALIELLLKHNVSRCCIEAPLTDKATQRAYDSIFELLESRQIELRRISGVTGAGLLSAAVNGESVDYVEPVYLRGFT